MFKRVLVLVLFLFGVFWWLTNRSDAPAEPKNDTLAEETVMGETGDEGDDADKGEDEKGDEEAVEAEGEADEAAAETTETTTVVTTTTTTSSAPVTTAPATTTPATTTPAPVVTAPVVSVPSVPARVTDVKVYVYEWNVDLSDKTIPAGTVNFTVQNDGRFTHDFSLSSHGNLGKVMPSETRTFTVKMRAGEYEVFSKRRQDYERGVKETFIVTP